MASPDSEPNGPASKWSWTFALSRLRLFWPKVPSRPLALGVFLLCTAIELGQLVQAPWLVAIRRTRLGGLALGTGFSATDILCYAVGAALGWLYDSTESRVKKSNARRAPG